MEFFSNFNNYGHTYFDPQVGPLRHDGRGAYSYKLSVYALLKPSMFLNGVKGLIKVEAKCNALLHAWLSGE